MNISYDIPARPLLNRPCLDECDGGMMNSGDLSRGDPRSEIVYSFGKKNTERKYGWPEQGAKEGTWGKIERIDGMRDQSKDSSSNGNREMVTPEVPVSFSARI
jgi:hypothetical protein